MSKVIKLKKGLDINLVGAAQEKLTTLPLAERYALTPSDFGGVVPKLLVKVGDTVKAGTPLFFDKNNPELLFTSPVSGEVFAINRGEKRKILNIEITPSETQEFESFQIPELASASKEQVSALILKSGLWPSIMQRPYGIIASQTDMPKAIFISGFDSAPMAPDYNYALASRKADLQKGIDALSKLTEGKVYLGLKYGTSGVLNSLVGVEQYFFKGAHPAGNVGVQIHHIDPINKGEIAWTVNIQDVAMIGKLFNEGKVSFTKTIALTGSEIMESKYVSFVSGAPLSSVVKKIDIVAQNEGDSVRLIYGNALTGIKAEQGSYVNYYTSQITAIKEGDKYEMFGWMLPRFKKFSVSRAYFSWLTPKKQYTLDTNLNGGPRPFVVSGLYEKYLPMDIYPVYLLKAILAGDIDKMENLGIYEVVEEDFALCEFVDPSKNDIQEIIREGINLMIKELN
ncbi:MAG: Na(+)-translocating NADH-quinone reductase subunit A [Rikenellaceae bacterium]